MLQQETCVVYWFCWFLFCSSIYLTRPFLGRCFFDVFSDLLDTYNMKPRAPPPQESIPTFSIPPIGHLMASCLHLSGHLCIEIWKVIRCCSICLSSKTMQWICVLHVYLDMYMYIYIHKRTARWFQTCIFIFTPLVGGGQVFFAWLIHNMVVLKSLTSKVRSTWASYDLHPNGWERWEWFPSWC